MPKRKGTPDSESKTAQLMRLMARREGATIQEMQEAAGGWAAHAVRGVIGSLRARKFDVVALKEKKKPTVYRLLNAPDELSVGEPRTITEPRSGAGGGAGGSFDQVERSQDAPPDEEEPQMIRRTGRDPFGGMLSRAREALHLGR